MQSMTWRRTGSFLTGVSESDPRWTARTLTGLRVMLGVLWVTNAGWKTPPDFGANDKVLLYQYVTDGIEHPVLPPFSWLLEHLVRPNLGVFGWGVLLVELSLGALLLSGSFTRLAALLGIGQSMVIGLSVLATPNEWPWSYYLMIALHLVIFVFPAGRHGGADGARAGLTDGVLSTRTWGIVALVLGVWATASAAADGDVVGGRGAGLGLGDAISFGGWNVLGGVLLLAIGACLLLCVRTPVLARVAAGVAGVAALVTLVLDGRDATLLGGNGSTVSVFAALCLVAVYIAPLPASRATRSTSKAASTSDSRA
ncbi:hypothetical protein BA895_10900 [Humibacillus sp. DSM 29435]|uniref:hypothetical protein n=1 Tax=Humibacillus sp. DSM 29435 TaxID=1869167 RepID=UPI0008729C13|nr:hypothetical protein [Humibacillus sp. DSM 29435]OFE14453.1 hypothetical protein BA895_10900 [Humibacillus sp. DSM 29435]